jgi:adenylate cyclase
VKAAAADAAAGRAAAERADAARAAVGPRLPARLLCGLAIGLAVLLADLSGGDLALPRRLELLTLDWRFVLRGPVRPGPDVLLVAIDDRSVAGLGQWPPSRDGLTAALDRLEAAGAGLVVLNLLLAEPAPPLPPPARHAIEAALHLVPGEPAGVRRGLEELLAPGGPDLRLGTAIAAAGRVALPYSFVFEPQAANIGGVPPWVRATAYTAVIHPSGAEPPPLRARGLLTLAPGLAAVGAGQGHVTLVVDEDGSLRFDLPAFPYAGELFPSLAVEAARLRLGLPRERVTLRLGAEIRLGALKVPLDARSRLLVNHYGPTGTVETVGFDELLAGRVPAGGLRDRVVVLGATAAATGGRFATPFTSQLPGSEHLATAIDNILSGRALRRDAPVRLADALGILGLALAGALGSGRRSIPASVGAALALALAWFAAAVLAFRADVWLGVAAPVLAGVAAAGAVEVLRAGAERRRRAGLELQRANLARYFPPAVVERLAAGGAGGGAALERTQEAAVMFVDLVGFTRAAEDLSPAEAMGLLRAFHCRVERAVFAHGGMVDKFVGDGALACFGVPDPTPSDCADALGAARALSADVAAWAAELAAAGRPPLRVAAGIHFGPVLMGDIGGERQFQFTVAGDTVNVASRLEALTRQADAAVIASDRAVERARATGGRADGVLAGFEPMPELRLRGRQGPVTAWRLPVPAPALDPAAPPADSGRPHPGA